MEGREQYKQKAAGREADGYIGTYFSEKSKGIYHFTFQEESGLMTEPELFYEAKNAKWVSRQGNSMVIPIEKDGRAGSCFLLLENGRVKQSEEILEEKQPPCYILQDGEWVYTANYHEGTVMVYRLDTGRPCVVGRIENGEGAGCHQALVHESWLMVPCLVQNRIRLFDREKGYEAVGEILFPEGTGPRHGVFNGSHSRFYVVSEWSNELFVFRVTGREFYLIQKLALLPEGRDSELENAPDRSAEAASAAIRLSRDEKFVYISIRGMDLLAVVELRGDEASVIQRAPCGGEHPRDFILSGNEKYVLTVNRFSGDIVCRERDRESGLLKAITSRSAITQGVALILD